MDKQGNIITGTTNNNMQAQQATAYLNNNFECQTVLETNCAVGK